MSASTGNWRWMATAVILCAVVMAPLAWYGSQGWIFPDSLSYFDMASDAVRTSPAVLLKNAYWSPAYPAVLALMMAVARPSLGEELGAIYAVNWLIFVFTAACFTVLMRTVVEWLRRNSWPELNTDGVLFKALLGFAYVLFLVANMNDTMWYATPDTLLEGTALLSAALALRHFLPGASWKHSVALGLTLGVGYWTKVAMFPPALMLLGILFLRPPKDGLGRRHAVVAGVLFALVAAPLILSLSHEKQRFTFGDSGKLNYSWIVGGIPAFSGWTGNPPDHGTPVHPVRTLLKTPLIIEFRTPVSGTLPIWYDPSYWWEGVKVPLSLRLQVAGVLRPLTQVHSRQTLALAFLAALTPLCLLNSRIRRTLRHGGDQAWILIVWPGLGCLMYAMALFSWRYIVSYLVLLGVGVALLVLQPFRSAIKVRALAAAALLLVLVAVSRYRPIVQLALHPKQEGPLVREEGRDNGPASEVVARELARLGIRPGDEISAIGHSLDAYYARLAGIRIVAQIWDEPDQIAGLSASDVREIMARLKQAGVKALISRSKPGFINDQGWISIQRTDVYVRLL